jgi:hypothetical protein
MENTNGNSSIQGTTFIENIQRLIFDTSTDLAIFEMSKDVTQYIDHGKYLI